MGGGEALGVSEDDDLGNAATDKGDDAFKSEDISILNSLIGHGSPLQYYVYTLHILIPFLKRLNDKYIKKNKIKAAMQRRLWDSEIKSAFQDITLRARWFLKECLSHIRKVSKVKVKALGRHLEEIHVTWAQFWKKPDKIANWHNEGLKNCSQKVETASGFLATPSGFASDGVRIFGDGVGNADLGHEGYRNAIELPEGAKMAIDYAAGGRLRKLRPEEAWETIEDLAQHEEEEWNDPIFSKKGIPNYIDAILEQELESMECRVESLMRNEVLLEYEVGFTFPKRPYQEELEARILNLIDHQEDQVR
ncbi:hypothetical protein Tco_0427322 [Tanacetum coccineum]